MKTNSDFDLVMIQNAANILQIYKNPARLKIIKMLVENQTMSMTQIQTKLKWRQPDTSLSLIKMKNAGVLNKVKDGRKSMYSLNRTIYENVLAGVEALGKKQ